MERNDVEIICTKIKKLHNEIKDLKKSLHENLVERAKKKITLGPHKYYTELPFPFFSQRKYPLNGDSYAVPMEIMNRNINKIEVHHIHCDEDTIDFSIPGSSPDSYMQNSYIFQCNLSELFK